MGWDGDGVVVVPHCGLAGLGLDGWMDTARADLLGASPVHHDGWTREAALHRLQRLITLVIHTSFI